MVSRMDLIWEFRASVLFLFISTRAVVVLVYHSFSVAKSARVIIC